jgi:hypothetical protein
LFCEVFDCKRGIYRSGHKFICRSCKRTRVRRDGFASYSFMISRNTSISASGAVTPGEWLASISW